MATISAGSIALTTSFDTEAHDTHIAHNDSRTVSTDYRLPIWGAFNSFENYTAPTSDRVLGAFIIKNSYNTDSQVAKFDTEPVTLDGDEKGAVRFCFDFLEIDPAVTINSLTFKIVCKVATGTTGSFFIRTGDYETTQTYDTSSSATTVSNTKATYEITVDIDDTIKDSPDSGGYGIWAEIDPGGSIDLDVYHISAKLNYTGKTRSKTEAVIKPFAAGNPEISMAQWATKGYGFVDKIPTNSTVRNLRTQFGFFSGQVARGYAVNDLYYRQIRYDGTDNEQLYYHTESDLSFITYQNAPGVDTSSIEIGTVDITLWNNLNPPAGIPQPPGAVAGSGQSDFITMDPVETDTTDQSKLKTSDSNDILRRYPSAIEDTTPRSFTSSTKRGWHIPEELVAWDYGNKVGLTLSQVTDTDFGVGNNQNGGYSGSGYTVPVPWSKEYNTTTNTYRSTADHFDCADTNDRFCRAYTPDASLGHYTGDTLQGLTWIGGYAMVQVAYQEPLFVGFIDASSSFNFTIPADGVTVTVVGEADISPQITTTALGGYLLDDGASSISTNIDLTNTGLAGLERTGFTIDPSFAFSTVFEGDLATTGESDTAFDTTVTVSANNNIATTQTQSYSFDFDLENTGLAGRIRTGFTIDPTTQLDVADLAENGVFLLQQPPANFVYTTDSATRTITIPLQGEDRAHERHLYIDQQTRTIVVPIQGEDRAHERHLFVDQQTRTITAEALDE